MSPVATKLLTAEEFVERHGGDHVELIDGEVMELPIAMFPHGVIANRFGRYLGNFVEEHNLGWTTSNDTFVLTRRDPDRVRGADVAFWSFQRVPAGPMPNGLVQLPPELVAEVRSPSDRWTTVMKKVLEYSDAGVNVVVVFDPQTSSALVYRPDELQQVFHNGDDLVFPDILPGFSMVLSTLFRDVAR
jgi:Uma2 family endonuclease